MEMNITIDENCKHCKKSLKYLKSLYKLNKSYYANRNMKDFTLIDGLILIPDYNSQGHLTHFHLEIANTKTLERMEKNRKACEKEVGIYKKFYEKAKKARK
jgi:hypothetical protein